MNEDVPVVRHWRLLRILTARRFGMAVRGLAQELEVDEKTIRRDLERLRGLGFPLTCTRGARAKKLWRAPRPEDCPPLHFTFDEVVALYLARLFLEPLAGTELWQAAQRALQKIRATLSEDALAHLEKLLSVYHFTTSGLSNYARKAEIINTLSLAIEDRRVVRLRYESQRSTVPTPRAVHPYKLVRYKGSLYLFAWAPEHSEVRNYKVDRIESAEMGLDTFDRPADFEVPSDLTGWFGMYRGDDDITVVVKFTPSAARYVRDSPRHPSEVWTKLRDGSLVVRFRLSSTVEIRSWVLGFGANAVILEPESLRRSVAEELGQLMEAYQKLGGRG
jgi:predicted DNA-binding transcriptional regulator YafY